MIKKSIIYIFIYTLLVGCNTQNPLSSDNDNECATDCYLDIEAPSLQMDENGYYHIEWLEGYNQTFSTLDANTGSTFLIQKVHWGCDKGITYDGNPVDCVNPASYTDNGIAHTVLSVWEEMIGDTITVYAGYYDDCDNELKDSIRVVIDNEVQN